jgi:hypothetical protein
MFSDVDLLETLLQSDQRDVLDIGTWIASELGVLAVPLVSRLVQAFDENDRSISFNVLDSITSCSEHIDIRFILAGLDQIASPDHSIAWKAQMLLASLPSAILKAMGPFSSFENNRSIVSEGIAIVLGAMDNCEPTEVIEAVANRDALIRRYGVVAAVKMAKRDDAPLLIALASDDPVVREFANTSLHLGLAGLRVN